MDTDQIEGTLTLILLSIKVKVESNISTKQHKATKKNNLFYGRTDLPSRIIGRDFLKKIFLKKFLVQKLL